MAVMNIPKRITGGKFPEPSERETLNPHETLPVPKKQGRTGFRGIEFNTKLHSRPWAEDYALALRMPAGTRYPEVAASFRASKPSATSISGVVFTVLQAPPAETAIASAAALAFEGNSDTKITS
jgi:hypothetical protein